jgi:bacterioferritin-associated ferredoxin
VIVCHCRVVTDHTVRTAISAGATTVADVAALSGAGTGCGGCVPTVEALLAEAAIAVASPERAAQRQRERRAAAGVPATAPAV